MRMAEDVADGGGMATGKLGLDDGCVFNIDGREPDNVCLEAFNGSSTCN